MPAIDAIARHHTLARQHGLESARETRWDLGAAPCGDNPGLWWRDEDEHHVSWARRSGIAVHVCHTHCPIQTTCLAKAGPQRAPDGTVTPGMAADGCVMGGVVWTITKGHAASKAKPAKTQPAPVLCDPCAQTRFERLTRAGVAA